MRFVRIIDNRSDILYTLPTMGRKPLDKPPQKAKAMISMRKANMTYQEIADIFGCTRQYVHQTIARWQDKDDLEL